MWLRLSLCMVILQHCLILAIQNESISSLQLSSSIFPTSTSEVLPVLFSVLSSSKYLTSTAGEFFSTSSSVSIAPLVLGPTPSPTVSSVTTLPPHNSSDYVYENQVPVYGNNTCEKYYAGGICTDLLSPFPVILTNLSRSNQIVATESVYQILFALQQFEAPQHCIASVLPLLCRYTFPTCDPAYQLATYQPICRRDCEIVRDFLCREPWEAMLKLLELLDFDYLDQPNCDPLSDTEAGDSPMCINTLNKGVIPRPLYTGSCYSGYGRGYQGNISVTESGLTCQAWSETYPHQHLLDYENYVELSGGHNYCRNPGERGQRPWCFTTNRTVRWEYCNIPECEPGPTCASHLSGVCRTQGTIGLDWVYINTSTTTPDQRANGTQSVIDHITQSGEYSDSCASILTEYLCISNFPSCDLTYDKPRPIMPCRSFCERVQNECGSQIIALKSFTRFIKYVYVSLDCDLLPVPNGGDAPECYEQAGVLSGSSDQADAGCFNSSDFGLSYGGNVSITESGKVCQKWVSQQPHLHPITPFDRPELEGNNYCRNPDARGSRPWCYTTDPGTRWEYCDIPACGSTPVKSIKIDTIIAIVVAITVFLLFLFVVFAICFCCCMRRRRHAAAVNLKNNSNGFSASNTYSAYSKGSKLDISDNPLYAVNPLTQDSTEYDGLKLPEFPRENIFYVKDLGQGHFGVVVQAEAIGIEPGKEKSTVAIKVMKEGASTQTKKEFFREASLMHTFKHPNIVKLLGVCIGEEPLCMIFEFMELGDLNQFLQQNTPKNGTSLLSVQQLVCMSIDVASGLDYLAQNHFVHRDLATRNCLVTRDLHVKISDFGLSQDVYTTDYFKMGDTELLPIRWMPPETILYAKFTVQSDIWSFGVVMWEIFSFGIQPYFSMTNEEVVQHVRNGNVMSCPERCPEDIYDLILDCWAMEPSERPTAGEVFAGLQRWSPDLSGVVANGDAQPSYQNMSTVQGYANAADVVKRADGYDHLEMSGVEGGSQDSRDATKISTCV